MSENIVYFLGAGASYNFGYPLTDAIMPEILKNLIKKDLFQIDPEKKTKNERQQEEELLEFIFKLYPGLQDIDLNNENSGMPDITEMLSMVDHCCLYNIPSHPELSDRKLLDFKELLNRAVVELLLDYEWREYDNKELGLLNLFLQHVKKDKRNSNVTIITTNYDLVIDRAFEDDLEKNRVDLGISYRDITSKIVTQPHNPSFKYYKLHGSLNWLKCDLCGQFYIHPNGSTAHHAFDENINDDNTCVCNSSLRLKSVLVAPSFVRDIRDSNLLQIWKSAMEAIRTADKLIMIGYSLPSDDLGIKSILMRGLNGRTSKQSLIVDVIQHGEKAKPNYKNLFGKSINYFHNGLEEYLAGN